MIPWTCALSACPPSLRRLAAAGVVVAQGEEPDVRDFVARVRSLTWQVRGSADHGRARGVKAVIGLRQSGASSLAHRPPTRVEPQSGGPESAIYYCCATPHTVQHIMRRSCCPLAGHAGPGGGAVTAARREAGAPGPSEGGGRAGSAAGRRRACNGKLCDIGPGMFPPFHRSATAAAAPSSWGSAAVH